jgi:predicted kinase
MEGYLAGRLGLVIDGTGKDAEKIKRQSKELDALGYETAMIFVNTDLETAMKRNQARPRSLPDQQVEAMWKDVQKNIGKFQSMFGKNFIVIDNSVGANYEKATQSGYKWASKFADQKIRRPVAKKWIERERAKK